MNYFKWHISEILEDMVVNINGEPYVVSDKEACIVHALLLLVEEMRNLTEEIRCK